MAKGIVKRAKIKSMYAVNMYCSECGARMERDYKSPVLTSNPPIITYRCVNGHSTTSSLILPVNQLELDESVLEEVDPKTGQVIKKSEDSEGSDVSKEVNSLLKP